MAVSEPHLLFSIMDRHTDWAVMICLVGLGQDIYDGEAGINEWFRLIKSPYLKAYQYLLKRRRVVRGLEYLLN